MNVTPEATMSPSELVAAEVRAHLARQRISGRRAAVMLGWTAPYLSRRLTGEIPFDVNDLTRVADLLDIPVAALFQAHPASRVTMEATPRMLGFNALSAQVVGLAA